MKSKVPEGALPKKPWENWDISQEKFKEFVGAAFDRDQRYGPRVGDVAPDFEIEHLDAQGKRTGEMFRLSSQRGRPIALVMGSYT